MNTCAERKGLISLVKASFEQVGKIQLQEKMDWLKLLVKKYTIESSGRQINGKNGRRAIGKVD